LNVAGLPPGASLSVLYFQGTASVAGGSGAPLGDALRCAAGSVLRLGARFANGGTSSFGAGVAGDPLVSIQGAVPPASISSRFHRAWYRNTASFCTAGVFNLSNGLRVVWAP
jgi:hypothetical protein